jgi:hypothetical protein
MSTVQKTMQYIGRKKIAMLLIAIAFSFVLYSYAIASTTISIASSRQLNKDILELQTQISELEWEHHEKLMALDLADAHNKGFTEINTLYFVSVDDSTEVALLD